MKRLLYITIILMFPQLVFGSLLDSLDLHPDGYNVRYYGFQTSYNASTNELSFTSDYAQYRDSVTSQDYLISNPYTEYVAEIDESGNLISGYMRMTGGIADLGISDGSTLYEGDVVDYRLTFDDHFSMYSLLEVDNTLLPGFDTDYTTFHNLWFGGYYSVDGVDLTMDNVFNVDWHDRGIGTTPHIDAQSVSEPGMLILFLLAGIMFYLSGNRFRSHKIS